MSITNPDTTSSSSSSVGPVTAALEQKIRLGLVKRDEAQRVLASKLDVLHQALTGLENFGRSQLRCDEVQFVTPNEELTNWFVKF